MTIDHKGKVSFGLRMNKRINTITAGTRSQVRNLAEGHCIRLYVIPILIMTFQYFLLP